MQLRRLHILPLCWLVAAMLVEQVKGANENPFVYDNQHGGDDVTCKHEWKITFLDRVEIGSAFDDAAYPQTYVNNADFFCRDSLTCPLLFSFLASHLYQLSHTDTTTPRFIEVEKGTLLYSAWFNDSA